MTYVYTENK